MADEYDYTYGRTQYPGAYEELGKTQSEPPRPEGSSAFAHTVFGTNAQAAPNAPQNDAAAPSQFVQGSFTPQSGSVTPPSEPLTPPIQPQPTASPVSTDDYVMQQTDYSRPIQGSYSGPQPTFVQTSPQTEPAPQPADYAQPNAQPEPETVHAEPAPEYSAYASGPSYGNVGHTAYGGYGAPPTNNGSVFPNVQPQPQPQPQVTEEKKDKKGLKVFYRVLVSVIIVSLLVSVIALALDRKKLQSGEQLAAPGQAAEGSTVVTAADGAPEMETKASPASAGETPAAGQPLTPTQIAAKVRASSVGILVYSGKSTGTAGEGSGVLWKEDGSKTYTYIITCAHVVNGSGYSYSVQTEDGKTYDAELVGADAKTDLAVLRTKVTGLSLAEFGDSSKLQVGDPVYAIGNPGGTEFFGSFTSGIVSAIDRSVKNTYTMLCIQHTAAINPGNSGGALVNEYGQVIGINSQKIASTEYEGMGFAIPLKSAQSVINSLASYGYVKDRPRLGITYAEALNYQQYSMIIKIRGLPSGTLVISEISSDSSLANTDAKAGDMIIKVNGENMTTPNVLLDKIENGKVGDELTLTLCRMDSNYQFKEFDVKVTLVEETRQNSQPETTTTQSYYGFDPFDFFNGNFGSYYGNGN